MLAGIILIPFVLAFIYAGIHEFLRFKSKGKASYGLVLDEETGTTYVTGIGEDAEVFDPEDFNPEDYNDPELKSRPADAPEEGPEDTAEEAVSEEPGDAPDSDGTEEGAPADGDAPAKQDDRKR